MTDLSTLRSRVYPERMRARLAELAASSTEIRDLRRVLGEPRMLAWAHSIGACTDPMLGSLVPPIPPRDLRTMVSEPEAELFLWTGVIDLEVVLSAWETHGPETERRAPAVLDFGCGCGRILRFLAPASGIASIHGVESRPDLAGWCRDNLPGAHVVAPGPDGALPHAAGTFDLVYAVSVFARLQEDAFAPAVSEIARVIRPAGLLVATTDDADALARLRTLAAPHALEVIEVLHAGMRGWQDVSILRKER